MISVDSYHLYLVLLSINSIIVFLAKTGFRQNNQCFYAPIIKNASPFYLNE